MGSGKSTVGRALADELGWGFADLDEDIEKREGMSISQIFDTRGEAEFRRGETAALRERVRSIERGRPCVIALGGGAFLSEENFEIVSNNGVSVWLDCPFSTVERRLAVTSIARWRAILRSFGNCLLSAVRATNAPTTASPSRTMTRRATTARILALPLF